MQAMLRISPLLLTFALGACGGGASPPPANDATDEKKETASASGGTEKSAAIDEVRKGFMSTCVEKPDYESFCTCTWDHISKSTTVEDLEDPKNPNTKKALASARGQCISHIPKSVFKEKFVKSCATAPEKGPFCECSFGFIDGKGMMTASAEELEKVQSEMRSACSKEWPEFLKGVFIEGCSEKLPEATCRCLYGALEKKYGKDKLRVILESGSDEVATGIKDAKASCPAK